MARHVNVQFLGGRTRPQSPRVQRTELERPADDPAARVKEWRKHVKVVERGAAITRWLSLVDVLPTLISSLVADAMAAV